MSFHSFDYLLFLPLAVLAFFATPHRWRWLVIVAASYGFYAAWRIEFGLLLLASTVIDYAAALGMEGARTKRRRGLWLGLSLAFNLGMLFFFKYFAWVQSGLGEALVGAGAVEAFEPSDIILPLGISFYTFQTISYSVDVFRGKRPAERHFGYLAAYVAFFPQLLAGPIERSTGLLPQLRTEQHFDRARAAAGLFLMGVGYFKKLVIADRIALFAPTVLADPLGFDPWQVMIAPFAMIYQVYCDLSGYTDIALGSALILGIKLSRNFNRPFAARTMRQFWNRWHMTVMRFFRDYVYTPMARRFPSRAMRNFAGGLTLLLAALWHGATLAWVAVAALAFALQLAERLLHNARRSLSGRVAWRPGRASRVLVAAAARIGGAVYIWTFLAFVGLLVGVPDLATAGAALRHGAEAAAIPEAGDWLAGTRLIRSDLAILFIAVAVLELHQAIEARRPTHQLLRAAPTPVRWGVYYALGLSILMFGVYGKATFVYFLI